MLTLLDHTTYEYDGFKISVVGMNCEQLSLVYPICSAMSRRIKEKTLELAKDEEMVEILRKLKDEEELTNSERIRLQAFDNRDKDFSIEEALRLVENYLGNIEKVETNGEDVTDEFKAEVLSSPRHLKQLANVIYQEFQAATEVSALKKI